MWSNNFIRRQNIDYLNQKGTIIVYFLKFYSKTRAIMAKRTIQASKSEDSEIDFKYDDEENHLTDGVVTDAILQIVIKISELLKKNIDSLNLPTVLKNALKKIKIKKLVYSTNKRAGERTECQGDQRDQQGGKKRTMIE